MNTQALLTAVAGGLLTLWLWEMLKPQQQASEPTPTANNGGDWFPWF